VADGFHTFCDLVADFLVLFALMHGHRGADAEHPYGHVRIEPDQLSSEGHQIGEAVRAKLIDDFPTAAVQKDPGIGSISVLFR
jgi:hypothetical protein